MQIPNYISGQLDPQIAKKVKHNDLVELKYFLQELTYFKVTHTLSVLHCSSGRFRHIS